MGSLEGFVAPGFERVGEAFAAQIESGDDLGAGFAVIRDGEPIIDIWGGWRDRAQTKPWTQDTLPPVFSTSKGVSSIVVAWCVERGLLRYEDKVSALWPEFAVHGKDQLTIAQALSHQAGVPGFPDPVDPDIWLDPPACAAAIAALAPLWPPGTASGYHPLTWGYIVGEIVARAAQRSLGSILREEICAPSNIDFHIGLPTEADTRIPDMQKPRKPGHFGEITAPRRAAFFNPWSGSKRSDPRWPRIEIPSANGHGTARAVAQLYDIFATGGEICGRRIVSPQTFAQLTAPRISCPDLVLPFTLDWRSGVMANNHGKYGPNRDTCGHSGSGGSCGFGDPTQRIAVGYVMNKQSEYLMGDPRTLKLIEALYACL